MKNMYVIILPTCYFIYYQVKLSNPSGKPLVYQVLIAGHDARDFRVPKGDSVSIAPRSSLHLNVEFTSRFLRPAEAILVLVGRRHGSAVGSTLTFNLRTQIDNIVPKVYFDILQYLNFDALLLEKCKILSLFFGAHCFIFFRLFHISLFIAFHFNFKSNNTCG